MLFPVKNEENNDVYKKLCLSENRPLYLVFFTANFQPKKNLFSLFINQKTADFMQELL